MRRFIQDLLNVPNTISLFRVLAAPVVAIFWLGLEWRIASLVLGTVVGITDLLDGWLARKLNQITDLGALIDQLGDLIFEATCLIIAVQIGLLWPGWLVIYLFREFTVTVIRTYVASRGGSLPSNHLGKAKSNYFQWGFFPVFLGAILNQPGLIPDSWTMIGFTPGDIMVWVGRFAIVTGVLVSLISGWQYLSHFAKFYAQQQAPKA